QSTASFRHTRAWYHRRAYSHCQRQKRENHPENDPDSGEEQTLQRVKSQKLVFTGLRRVPQNARDEIDQTTACRDVAQQSCQVVLKVQHFCLTSCRRRRGRRITATLIVLRSTRITIRRLTAH